MLHVFLIFLIRGFFAFSDIKLISYLFSTMILVVILVMTLVLVLVFKFDSVRA